MKAEYVCSSTRVDKCPQSTLPEFAFIGRSNVGKSSLINMLTGRRRLALTSQMPGKTLLINHFLINGKWWLVDLPGYGYAQRGKEVMERLSRLIRSYVIERTQLTCLFVLIDIRLSPQKKDLDFIHFLGEERVPFAIVFTKSDKLSRTAAAQRVEAFEKALRGEWEELPPRFITSSKTGAGREALWEFICSSIG